MAKDRISQQAKRPPNKQPNLLRGAIDACQDYIAKDYEEGELFDHIMGGDAPVDDRAAAIISACELENSLEQVVRDAFDAEKGRRLFGSSGVLSTFSGKIDVAYALGVLGDVTKANFDIIRNVRNVFAHAKRPAKFSTQEITNICNLLTAPAGVLRWSIKFGEEDDARERYVQTCWKTGFLLDRYLTSAKPTREALP